MRLSTTFDILGPIMVGPSSSHTAGALRIAAVMRDLVHPPIRHVRFTLHNSFALTYRGHGTDRALLAGILGLSTYDPRVKDAFELADAAGLGYEFVVGTQDESLHPNTVDIETTSSDGRVQSMRGESVGGGKIHISAIGGVKVDLEGRMPALIVAHLDVRGMLAMMTHELSFAGVNVAYMSSYRTNPGEMAYTVFETDDYVGDEVIEAITHHAGVIDATRIHVSGTRMAPAKPEGDYEFHDAAELLAICGREGLGIGEVMRLREYAMHGREYADARMDDVIAIMGESVRSSIASPEPSLGGLIGGEARKLHDTLGSPLACGRTATKACAYALSVLERSATMGVIVAAPTAGSAGVLPGCVMALAEDGSHDDAKVRDALYAAAALGAIVEAHASVSGAEGGCQAEVGTASAMAAVAATQLLGGSATQCLDAAAITIGNMLGLVCDPVRGLVEVPCQSRNASGVMNALIAAQMALAGIRMPIPLDEVIEAQRQVGVALPTALRETAEGGLAACPSACGRCHMCS